MYQAGAGGVAGGVVVAGLDCLGFLSRIRLCLLLGILIDVFCKSLFIKGSLLIQYSIGDL